MSDHSEFHGGREFDPEGEPESFVIDADILYQVLGEGGLGTWRADFDQRVLVVDACDAELLGFEPTVQRIGFDEIMRVIHPDDLERMSRQFAEERVQFGRYEFDLRVLLPNDEVRWLLARGTIFRDETGGVIAAGVHIDVTEQRRIEEALRENRRRLSTLMSNLPGMAYRCLNDHDWTMLFVSEGCERLCGYDAEQLVSGEVVWGDLVCVSDQDWLWESVQEALDAGEPFEVEYRIRHADGTHHWMWEQGRGVYDDGKLVAIEGFITDVTARKQAEEELREADRRKDQFLAMLGHELRNPLTAIISSAEFLEGYEASDSALERVQRVLSRQSRQMKRLIDGLLDVSRITRQKITLDKSKVDLLAVLQGLLEDRTGQLARRHIEISVGAGKEHMWMDADPVRLGQIFDNLLMNAIEHTKPGDTISLRARHLDGTAEIVVADSGEGIEATLLDVIFEPFQQGPKEQVQAGGGLGLGLALTKGLVELHGGHIEARSEGKGKGAQFVVHLPLTEAPERVAPTKPKEAGVRRDILLIEDDPDVAEVLTLIIDRVGHDVRVASSASEGLEMAAEQRPDLVLCDLGLPGISGYELAVRLRADEGLSDLPLVALTGYGGESVRERALESGFDEHVTKPVSMTELAEVCDRMCGTRH
ncbi:hybrid sensor histidine kinase/response regulator [Persicimonas caeni]|nr:PAS domain-containing protein [Persicimonas caeni]